MRLKVLGAYGASDAEHNLTGYLIDDWLARSISPIRTPITLAIFRISFSIVTARMLRR